MTAVTAGFLFGAVELCNQQATTGGTIASATLTGRVQGRRKGA